MSLSYAQEIQCRAHRPRPVYRPPDYNRPTCVYWNVLMETMKNAENPWQEVEFLFKQFHHPYSVFFNFYELLVKTIKFIDISRRTQPSTSFFLDKH